MKSTPPAAQTGLAYRPAVAAQKIGVSRSQLYKLIKAGELDTVKIGTSRLVPHDALVALLARSAAA